MVVVIERDVLTIAVNVRPVMKALIVRCFIFNRFVMEDMFLRSYVLLPMDGNSKAKW